MRSFGCESGEREEESWKEVEEGCRGDGEAGVRRGEETRVEDGEG